MRDANGETLEFYGQVGNGPVDHAYWGPPETLPMDRPASKVTRLHPGSDLTAESAATLAAAALAWAPEDFDHATLASEALALQICGVRDRDPSVSPCPA